MQYVQDTLFPIHALQTEGYAEPDPNDDDASDDDAEEEKAA
ncbi:hypothetical protein ACIQVR_39325 [Streptomyces xanthochromogenes]